MKKLIASIVLATVAFCATVQLQAQSTNSIPQSIADVTGSISSYFTSFNTNLTTFQNKLDLWTAMNYQHGVNTSAELGVSYDTFAPTTGTAIAPEAVFRNIGAGGDLLSYQGGVGFSVIHYDTKLTGYIDGGNNQQVSRVFIEFGLRVKKAITAHTYGGVGLGLQKYFGSSGVTTPTFSVYAGMTL